MTSATVYGKATEDLIHAALRGALTEVQAQRLAKEDPEVVALALLAASKRQRPQQPIGVVLAGRVQRLA